MQQTLYVHLNRCCRLTDIELVNKYYRNNLLIVFGCKNKLSVLKKQEVASDNL